MHEGVVLGDLAVDELVHMWRIYIQSCELRVCQQRIIVVIYVFLPHRRGSRLFLSADDLRDSLNLTKLL